MVIKNDSEIQNEIKEKNLSGVPSIDEPWRKYYDSKLLDLSVPDISLSEFIYLKNKDRQFLSALRYKNVSISYERLFEEIEKTGKRFKKYGVKENDYVSLAMPLTPETIYMIYGLDSIGACANLIDPRVPTERMKYYLDLAQSKIAAVVGTYASTMRKASKNSSLDTIINVSPLETLKEDKSSKRLRELYELKMLRENIVENFQNAFSHLTDSPKIIPYDSFAFNCGTEGLKFCNIPNKTGVVEYTSGTTGVPKGLELSSKGMNITVEQLIELEKCEPGESILAIMPPFISYGAVCGIHNSLSSGFEMILIPNFSVENFAQLIDSTKPNNIICVPSFFEHVINSDIFDGKDLSYIKRIIFGGDKTHADFELKVNNWLANHNNNSSLIKGGGMAEYSSCMFLTPYDETKKPNIYGVPLPKTKAKIMKNDYEECSYYEIGEIYISSPQEMKGYLYNPSETEKFFYVDENGVKWGRTGDLGFVDTDGMFTLTSRKKQMIVRPDGHNVFPSEIENAILENEYVKNCVVIGVKDPNSTSGEYPVAFIELVDVSESEKSKILSQIINFVNKKLPLRDRPRNEDYQLLNMVYSKEGKLDRNAILSLYKKQKMQS